MRYPFGFLAVCALSAVPLVGCTDDGGDGGTGGSAGDGGTAGSGGSAGTGGTSPATNAWGPDVAIAPSGNAIVVWVLRGDEPAIWSNRYTAADGWGNAEPISGPNLSANPTDGPRVAMDSDGNAIVVWVLRGDEPAIWSNRNTAADGWGNAEPISGPNLLSADPTDGPRVAMDSDGNAIAVWVLRGDEAEIWSNRYTAADGWGNAEPIAPIGLPVTRLLVAVDPDGNALAVWSLRTGSGKSEIWSNRYTAADGWGTAERISTGDGLAQLPQVGMDMSGNAIVVWKQGDVTAEIWSNRYTPADGWGMPERISTGDGPAGFPQVGMDMSGNAIVVWRQGDGNAWTIWSNRYTPADGWGTPVPIETSGDVGTRPQVAVDPSGNAVAMWTRCYADCDSLNRRDNVWSARYTPADGWGMPERIHVDPGGVVDLRVVVDPSGNALAVWASFTREYRDSRIWSNRYTPADGWNTAELFEFPEGQ